MSENLAETDLLIQTHTLPRQIQVEHFCLKAPSKRQVEITSEQERLGFFICLSGEDRLTIEDHREVVYLRKGVCGAYYEPAGLLNKAAYSADEPFNVLSVTMPRDTLENAFFNGGDALSRLFERKKFPSRPYALRFFPMQPLIRTAVSQILNPPVDQDFFPAYLEAKTLELSCLMLQALCAEDGSSSSSLSKKETARLFQVRALLEENLENPLSPIELARQCGLSVDRMNKGFKEVFGQTIFQYLRELRMEQARDLLVSGQCSVTDACFRVGYSNLSHFAKLYQHYFGHSPVKDRKRFFSAY